MLIEERDGAYDLNGCSPSSHDYVTNDMPRTVSC